MDTLSRLEIETVLASRLPNCVITCTISADNTLSIDVTGPERDQFTAVNIDRTQYHGEVGINRLAREILEEMVFSRKLSGRSDSRRAGQMLKAYMSGD
ncbi:hypothetical protein K1X80_16615 [Pseudomonas sp. So3.2b]|uniref:hypothetical protein n=1 Tax=Pseudomonas sp. So3.2b TaxID=2864101 RepID=UPI001C68EC32|nr:hypothetical protein [Pseudomonas sp. So3.2b]QYM66678.1 hypothetical protein K1X80_16615 [Pseudomonas sp. So3.2b]